MLGFVPQLLVFLLLPSKTPPNVIKPNIRFGSGVLSISPPPGVVVVKTVSSLTTWPATENPRSSRNQKKSRSASYCISKALGKELRKEVRPRKDPEDPAEREKLNWVGEMMPGRREPEDTRSDEKKLPDTKSSQE